MSLNPAVKKLRIWFVGMGKEAEESPADVKIESNVRYARSRNGILAILEMALSLMAFISQESVSECQGDFYCAPPAYLDYYRFFGFVSFTSFLFTGAILAARMLGTADRVPLPSKYRLFTECFYLVVVIVLYFFANAFMIAHHGNRLGYQCAAVFGVVAMSFYCVQLAMYLGESKLSDVVPFRNATSSAAESRQGDDDGGSRLSWEPPPGVATDQSDAGVPTLGPVILRPRRSSVDDPGSVGKGQPNVAGTRTAAGVHSNSPSTARTSRNSDCTDAASINSANFVSVDLEGVTAAPPSPRNLRVPPS